MSCPCNCGYTCGGPGVCELPLLDCIEQHWKRDCGHLFNGPWVTYGNGGTTTCSKCKLPTIVHDMEVGP